LSGRRARALGLAGLGLLVAPVVAVAGHGSGREVVDLEARPAAVSLASLGPGRGFAAAYDDRLNTPALRYAQRGAQGWVTSVVASSLDGRRVGREPSLAISRTGLRLLSFRSDLSLDPGPADGVLYAARATATGPWAIARIDADGFGAQAAFDPADHPAVAYLARVGEANAADVRLARLVGGTWVTQTVESTTFLQARSRANASRVGLAFDAAGNPWVAYVDPATHSLRAVTPGHPSLRVGTVPATAAQAALAFGPGGREVAVAAGLAFGQRGMAIAERHGARPWRMVRAPGDGATAPSVIGFDHGLPLVAYRDDDGAALAVQHRFRGRFRARRLLLERYQPSLTTGSVGVARAGSSLGVALVAPRGLLEFVSRPLPS
jgi:hypothetical protein